MQPMQARVQALLNALDQRMEGVLVGDRDALAELYVALTLAISLTSGLLSPSPWVTRFNAVCAPLVLLLAWARKAGRISRETLTWSTLFLVNVIVTGSVWIFGGVASIAMVWYLVLPLPVMMVLGMRGLLPTFALIATSIGATIAMQAANWLPALPSPGSDLLWPIATFTMMALSILSLPIVAYISLQRILALLSQRNQELRNTQAVLLTQQKQQEEFVASVSHELRTPMNAIVGFLQAIDKPRMASARNREMLDAMNHSARHLLTVINDLLDFSQIQVGSLRVTSRPMALADLLNDVTTMFESQLHERGVRMVSELSPDLPPWVQGDADRLTQIIINLLGNAAKFTRVGSVTLRAMRTPKGLLRIEVQDTGCGIAPEQLSAVFDRFSQITDNTRREYGGTGLGLSISQNLIRLMGGTIGVNSSLHVGSTFWFELPLTPAQAPEPEVPQPTATAPTPDLSGCVLIVDDSPINRVVARQMLMRDLPQLTIVEASSGAQALDLVQSRTVDLILMDVIMPEMDGIETTRRVLSLPHPPAVLGLTADITETVHNGCIEAGMLAVLTKPYARAVLVDLVAQTLATQAQAS
jgi:signal transduction histidine kinase/CheY-like chemotaxis protein